MQRKAQEAQNEKTWEELDRELEEGLRDSFPASDPPSAIQPVRRHPAGSEA